MLREVTNFRLGVQVNLATCRAFNTCNQPEEGRLANPIWPRQCNLVSTDNLQRDAVEDRLVAVLFDNILDDYRLWSFAWWLREFKVNRTWTGLGLWKNVNLLKLLDTALDHSRFRLVALPPLDEFLPVGDFTLLGIVRLEVTLIRFFLETLVVFVVTRVLRGATIFDFDNLLADRIKELGFVRNTDDGAVVIRDVVIHQPVLCGDIEVVCRFVKEQIVRLLQQQLCHRDAHLPAS